MSKKHKNKNEPEQNKSSINRDLTTESFDQQGAVDDVVNLLLKNAENELFQIKQEVNHCLQELNNAQDDVPLSTCCPDTICSILDEKSSKTEEKLIKNKEETKTIIAKQIKKPDDQKVKIKSSNSSENRKIRQKIKYSPRNDSVSVSEESVEQSIVDDQKKIKANTNKETPRNSYVKRKSTISANPRGTAITKRFSTEEKAKYSKNIKENARTTFPYQVSLESIREEKEVDSSSDLNLTCPKHYCNSEKCHPPKEDKIIQTTFETSNKTITSTPRSDEFLPNTPNLSGSLEIKAERDVEAYEGKFESEIDLKVTVVNNERNEEEEELFDFRYEKRLDVINIIKEDCGKKLSIQTLPAVDIRRPLVTQRLPDVDIKSSINDHETKIDDKNVKYLEFVYEDKNESNETYIPKPIITTVIENKIDETGEELEEPEEDSFNISQRSGLTVREELNLNIDDIPSVKTLKEIQTYLEQRCALIRKRLQEENETPGEFVSLKWRLNQKPKWRVTSPLIQNDIEINTNNQLLKYNNIQQQTGSPQIQDAVSNTSSSWYNTDTLESFVEQKILFNREIQCNSESIEVNKYVNKKQQISEKENILYSLNKIRYEEVVKSQIYPGPSQIEQNQESNVNVLPLSKHDTQHQETQSPVENLQNKTEIKSAKRKQQHEGQFKKKNKRRYKIDCCGYKDSNDSMQSQETFEKEKEQKSKLKQKLKEIVHIGKKDDTQHQGNQPLVENLQNKTEIKSAKREEENEGQFEKKNERSFKFDCCGYNRVSNDSIQSQETFKKEKEQKSKLKQGLKEIVQLCKKESKGVQIYEDAQKMENQETPKKKQNKNDEQGIEKETVQILIKQESKGVQVRIESPKEKRTEEEKQRREKESPGGKILNVESTEVQLRFEKLESPKAKRIEYKQQKEKEIPTFVRLESKGIQVKFEKVEESPREKIKKDTVHPKEKETPRAMVPEFKKQESKGVQVKFDRVEAFKDKRKIENVQGEKQSVGTKMTPKDTSDQCITCNLNIPTLNIIETRSYSTQYSPVHTVKPNTNNNFSTIQESRTSSPKYKDSSSSTKSSKFFKGNLKKSSTPLHFTSTTTGTSESSSTYSVSDGEVHLPCECSTSIGEIHLCHFANNIRNKVKKLKNNPNHLIGDNYGNKMYNIAQPYKYYDNWVTYYISKSEHMSSGEIGTESNLSSVSN